MRTSRDVLNWFETDYDIWVIPIRLFEEHLYHLDCVIFPITPKKVVLCTDVCDQSTIGEIERIAQIIDLPYFLVN